MFRIECFCDDAKLAKLLWALSELGAYNLSSQPVADNTKAKANGAASGAEHQRRERLAQGALGVSRAFLDYAGKHKLKEAQAAQLREFTVSIGWSAVSYVHVVHMLRMVGVLEVKKGTSGTTQVYIVRRDTKGLEQRAEKAQQKLRIKSRERSSQRRALARSAGASA